MQEYINNNLPGFWFALGFAMLAAEILLFGFTTIIFLFVGLGAVTTGLLMMAGVLPETWLAGIASCGIATGISTMLLWKPLKALQNHKEPDTKPQSDLVGLDFVLTKDISTTNPGKYHYSGIEWIVELDRSCKSSSLLKGERVEVVSVDVGLFRVKNLS